MKRSYGGIALEAVVPRTLCRVARRVMGRLRVDDAKQVPGIVRECAEAGVALHPVSGGKNWGMGSYLPHRDDAIVLDLSGLKHIGPLDRDAEAVRIEAGVTQQELHLWLRREAPEFVFNVTGAGGATSILGNALERGLGYLGPRGGEVTGMEVVLPDGTWHRPEKDWFATAGYIGAGPQIDALFSQANFGIVTAGWLRLRPRQECEAAVLVSGEFEPVFECVRQGYKHALLTAPVHMAGGARSERVLAGLLRQRWQREPTGAELRAIFPQNAGAHSALASVQGRPRVVAAITRELRAVGGPRVRVRAVTSGQIATAEKWLRRFGLRHRVEFLGAMRPLLALAWNEPTNAGLVSLKLPLGESEPDAAEEGCIYLNAGSAPTLAHAINVERTVAAAWASHAITRCFLSSSAMVHVVSLMFADGERGAVHTATRELARRLRECGYPPYRLGSLTMESGVPSPLARKLKTMLDPRQTIAPGNYVV